MPCVVAPDEMDGRRVVSGTIGCPVCEVEHAIVEGVVNFGEDPLLGTGSRSDDLTVEETPDAGRVQALLNLGSSGGYVVLVGSCTRLAEELAASTSHVHFVGVNPPPGLRATESLSLLRSPNVIPLKDNSVRGVLMGREYVRNRWMDEAGRVSAEGGRLVAVIEQISAAGVLQLAVGEGMWVGKKQRT
jgi:hypothetical protein